MQEKLYSLPSLLDTMTKRKNNRIKKRLIFDQAPIEGLGVKWVIAFYISLPILLYIGIFNPIMFALLGIAQAIIFYIIFLSMLMIMVITLTFINNTKVIRSITASWNTYFPEIDFTLVIASGTTPYKDFFIHYDRIYEEGMSQEALIAGLEEGFIIMQDENKDLLEAMHQAKGKANA
ncbi:MAG: hypothetical protein Q9M36_13975 [Sulfurovum sp.]|nr:hypothetical protein [Sulfurovum sp.]